MEKITWLEAVKIEKDLGAYTLHIGYISESLAEEHPDCAAVVLDPDILNFQDPKAWLYLILDDPEMEEAVGSFYKRLAER